MKGREVDTGGGDVEGAGIAQDSCFGSLSSPMTNVM
jgi:hypothetical protein